MRNTVRLLFACAVVLAAASSASAQAGPRPSPAPDSSLVVSTRWLAANVRNPRVVVLSVARDDSAYRVAHIAGARFVSYMDFTPEIGGIGTQLPPVDDLRRLFESLGVSDASHVVLTGPPLMATRAFFTLDYLGLTKVSILDGGLPLWRADGGAIATGPSPTAAAGHITAPPRPGIVASAEYALGRIGKSGTSFLDTRTEGEYLGTEARRGLPSNGHIEGARWLEWQRMFRDPNEFTPKNVSELRQLWSERVVPGDTVVTYCLVGYRASGSYFISRYLGYTAKLYDGSYDEWSKRSLPVVKAPTPLRVP